MIDEVTCEDQSLNIQSSPPTFQPRFNPKRSPARSPLGTPAFPPSQPDHSAKINACLHLAGDLVTGGGDETICHLLVE